MKISIQWNKILFILSIYAVLFLFFVTNALVMTSFDFAPAVCVARLAAVAATVLVVRYYGEAVIPLSSVTDSNVKKERRIYFGGVFTVGIIVLFIHYIGLFPGCYDPDTISQLSQAASGQYNDWHPAIHTLLFFTLPLKLFRRFEMIVAFQILCFSASFAYLVYSMRRARCPQTICLIMAAVVLLSPMTDTILCHPFKDCGFAIFATLVTALYINIVDSHGTWLKSKVHIVLFAVSAALCTMMRHNSILYTLPLLGAVLFFAVKRRRSAAIAVALSFVIMAGIKWPLYRGLHVQHSKTPVIEMTGMCMSIMGRAVSTEPEQMDGEVRDFLYRMADKETWKTHYKTAKGFNKMKFEGSADTSFVEIAGLKNILRYTGKTIKTNGMAAIQEFLYRVRFIYQIDGDATYDVGTGAADELTDLQINPSLRRFIRRIMRLWKMAAQHTVLKWLFYFYVGWADALMIIIAIIRVYRDKDFSPCFHALPIWCYNAGTALLLTGEDIRYFYYTLPIFIPILFVSLRQEPQGGKQ